MNAALAIQSVIYDQLQASANVQALLGEGQIYDAIPNNIKTPYVLFGKIESNDWSTGTENGEEHLFELIIWSSKDGRKEVVAISEAVKENLLAMPITVNDHHLINFTWESTISKREKDSGYFSAELLFRAVSEPINV